MCAQLDLEVMCKRPKKRKDRIIFINFGIKKFAVENAQKNKTLMFECYNLLAPMEWGTAIFWGWFTITYGYFLKFSYFCFFWEIDFFNYVKLQKLVKKTQGILGVKGTMDYLDPK
jgi:hypothetical protein